MADPLLSDLCTICHIHPHRYRCPRCSTLTCSLPCIKRHKQWAQCSGIRDPAAYLKRSDLATPRGIDHDYNFLTSVERRIDNAARDVEERGVVLQEEDTRGWKARGKNGPMKGEIQVKEAIEKCKVVIDRAPKGMARGKQNKTQWDKKRRCLSWTVEWVLDDGRKELRQCLELLPISKAYAAQFETAEPPKKKRKSNKHRPETSTSTESSTPLPTQPTPVSVPASSAPSATTDTSASTDTSAPIALSAPIAPSAPSTASTLAPQHPSSPSPTLNPPPSPNFYLHLPSTPTSSTVLIPLLPTSTLSTILPHRLVLEFPTIYVMRHPPSRLPTGFVTEEDFLGGVRRGEVGFDLDGLMEEGEVVSGVGEDGDGQLRKGGALDEKVLVGVLERDLGGGGVSGFLQGKGRGE